MALSQALFPTQAGMPFWHQRQVDDVCQDQSQLPSSSAECASDDAIRASSLYVHGTSIVLVQNNFMSVGNMFFVMSSLNSGLTVTPSSAAS